MKSVTNPALAPPGESRDDRSVVIQQNAPVRYEYDDSDIMPSMAIPVDQAVARLSEMQEFIDRVMVEGPDYGKLPGMKQRMLYQAGAEKLLEIYAYAAYPELYRATELPAGHPENPNGKDGPYFEYIFRTEIRNKRSGNVIGIGWGSCNSMETKYRWRSAQRKCPACGAESLINGKPEFGRGEFKGVKHWLCYKARGGCGECFHERDQAIIDQEVGKIPNPDLHDVKNTLLKIAEKRSVVDGTKRVTRTSGIFISDDGADDDEATAEKSGDGKSSRQQPRQQAKPTDKPKPDATAGDPQHPERKTKITVNSRDYWTRGITAAQFVELKKATAGYDEANGKDAAKGLLAQEYKLSTTLDLTSAQAAEYIGMLTGRGEPAPDDDDIPDFGDDKPGDGNGDDDSDIPDFPGA